MCENVIAVNANWRAQLGGRTFTNLAERRFRLSYFCEALKNWKHCSQTIPRRGDEDLMKAGFAGQFISVKKLGEVVV